MSATTSGTQAEVEAQSRSERFGFRLTPDELARIRLGADAKKMSVSAFMIQASLAAVESAIDEERHTTVSKAVFERIMTELEEAGEPIESLAMLLKGPRRVELPPA